MDKTEVTKREIVSLFEIPVEINETGNASSSLDILIESADDTPDLQNLTLEHPGEVLNDEEHMASSRQDKNKKRITLRRSKRIRLKQTLSSVIPFLTHIMRQ